MSSPPRSESPSPHSSPGLSSSSQPRRDTRDDYFGDVVYESPESDDCDSGPHRTEDEDAGTDSTLDDAEYHSEFGHPLQRMPRLKSADHGLCYDSDTAVKVLLNSSHSSQSSLLSISDQVTVNYDRIIDILLEQIPNPFISRGDENLIMFDAPRDDTLYRHQECLPPVMVKRFNLKSPELRLLLELNVPESREDPWNVAPHILRTVEKDDYVYLCMQRLYQYNDPPLVSVSQYIDFFRQVLEGLSFLHEQHIAGLRCAEPTSYMVDLSSAPHPPSPKKDGDAPVLAQFDRFSFPVRYYFADFSQATRFSAFSPCPSTPSSPGAGISAQRRPGDPFKHDVQDCGALFDKLLLEVPQISAKFKSLTKAMTLGGFDADDARRLFEALCRSLDADVFEQSASPQPANAHPGRARSLAYLTSGSPRSPDGLQEKVISR